MILSKNVHLYWWTVRDFKWIYFQFQEPRNRTVKVEKYNFNRGINQIKNTVMKAFK